MKLDGISETAETNNDLHDIAEDDNEKESALQSPTSYTSPIPSQSSGATRVAPRSPSAARSPTAVRSPPTTSDNAPVRSPTVVRSPASLNSSGALRSPNKIQTMIAVHKSFVVRKSLTKSPRAAEQEDNVIPPTPSQTVQTTVVINLLSYY